MNPLPSRIGRMRKQDGYSLVELVTALAVGSVLVAVAVGLLHALFRVQRDGLQQACQALVLDRLAGQFRQDIHAATRAAAVGPAARAAGKPLDPWELQMPGDRRVQYRTEQGGLVRLERQAGRLLSQERFQLPEGTKAEISLPQQPGAGLARLRIARADAPWAGRGPPLLVAEAVLGLDYRFGPAAEGQPGSAAPTPGAE